VNSAATVLTERQERAWAIGLVAEERPDVLPLLRAS
jgi:hypothetical protein